MTLSLIAPIRDEGPSFRERLCACIRAVSGTGVELVLLDNQSIDGCTQGLPPDVLIVRTDRIEPPVRLWRLGRRLAGGEALVWLPGIASVAPDRFRSLVEGALHRVAAEARADSGAASPRLSFTAARTGPALLTSQARSTLDRWGRIPIIGRTFAAASARWLPLLISLNATEEKQGSMETAKPDEHTALAKPTRARSQSLSVIITTHNEGAEVLRTVESVRANTSMDHEIIIVDDGSTDGSCTNLQALGVRVIRHAERVGVAYSRNIGSLAATGDVFAYLDAHQRVEPGCLDRCAEVAAVHGAIACPPCRPLNRRYPVSFGATFSIDSERGFFSARHRTARPRRDITRISALRSPAYVIPRGVYPRVEWITALRGWGATDFSVALKAFFTDVDILYVHTSATEHLFRKRFPYEASWESVWRNHALIARVCFDDRTWSRYWLPEVFRKNLSEEVLHELDSPAVLAERDAFHAVKVRPDREFWRGLLRVREPGALGSQCAARG